MRFATRLFAAVTLTLSAACGGTPTAPDVTPVAPPALNHATLGSGAATAEPPSPPPST